MKVYTFNNLFIGTANKKFVKSAIKEMKRIDPDVKVIDRYPDGIFTFSLKTHREVFFYRIKESPPIFLRHVHPIDRMFFIPMEVEPSEYCARGVMSLSSAIKPGKKIAVQARRISGRYDCSLYSFKKAVDPILVKEHRAIPTVKRPDQVISIYIADASEIDYSQSITCSLEGCPTQLVIPWQGICFMGISTPEENLCEWSGGKVRFSKENNQKSRSEFKLLEAFEIFKINPKKGGLALDLGSSPGGWMRVLAQKGYLVTGVDRASVDRDVQSLEGVRFIRRDAMHFRDDSEKYDILTNDINREPSQSAKIMAAQAEHLKKGAPFVMTIKLSGKNPEKIIRKVKNTLESKYEIKLIRQLFHNRHEVTVYGVKK